MPIRCTTSSRWKHRHTLSSISAISCTRRTRCVLAVALPCYLQVLLTVPQAAFTPLVSPAVTPHDAHFGYDFAAALPSAYFSPLTSPALKAQQKHLQQQTNAMLSHFHTPGSSASASPVDPDVDMLGDGTPASAPLEPSVKLRGKRPAPRTSRAATRVSQSPIAKPARRKQTLSATSLPKEVRDLVLERSQKTQTPRGQHIASALVPAPDGSEAESLSPEPLTEVMGPPPKPVSSTSQSPSIMPNSHASATSHTSAPAPFSDSSNLKDVCPATPASLMRLRQQPSSLTTHAEIPPLDDLSLPAPASTTPNDADDITPRIPARKTPKLGPLSTPGGPAALSAMPSPTLSALASPTSPGVPLTGNSSRKDTPLRTSRSSTAVPTKKRSSTGTAPNSTLVSPALRPRLSPHLQPSGTGNHSGTGSGGGAAALLASRSNYQNLVEGTTLPGISYPSSLSTNLTSKRASHKLAEQGRRDRINSALQELQAMLPASLSVSSPTTPTATAATAKDRDGAAASINNPQNSKATKVESAITYIKLLQQQCADQARLLDDRDRELAAVRAELAMLKHRE